MRYYIKTAAKAAGLWLAALLIMLNICYWHAIVKFGGFEQIYKTIATISGAYTGKIFGVPMGVIVVYLWYKVINRD